MKTQALLLSVSLAVAGVTSAHAQISRPIANGTAIGAIAGALIGGHNHDRWGEGALIGAAAGALIGAVVDQSPSRTVYQSVPCNAPVTVVRSAPVAYVQPATQVVYVQQPQPTRVVYVAAPVCAPKVVVVEDRHHRRPTHVVYVTPSYPRW